MRAILLTVFMLMAIAACTDDRGNHGSRNGNDSGPVASDPSIPEKPVDPGGSDSVRLTAQEIEEVRYELTKNVNVSKWKEHTQQERSVLAGAALQIALSTVKPLDWTTMTDQDVEYLLNLFFDPEFNLIRKGTTL